MICVRFENVRVAERLEVLLWLLLVAVVSVTDLLLFDSYRSVILMVWLGTILASLNAVVVVAGRARSAIGRMRRRRIERRYEPIVRRALEGDGDAQRRLTTSPNRHRFYIARLMVWPLQSDRDPQRIAQTRALFEAMSFVPVADQLLRSRFWWKRATAIRALGVLQIRERTAAVVAALDDEHPEVRASALDAIADLRDPESLNAVLVRLHDESLHRGRRLAAVAAFGPACEPLLLEMAQIDAGNRLDYAQALRICGTRRAVPILSRWTQDPDPKIRAVAFEALGNIGLDERTASLAIDALHRDEVNVRATAAYALRSCAGSSDAASRLAQHLDDQWPVAVQSAKALRAIGHTGIAALQRAASRSDLAGELARQTLWEVTAQC